MRRVAQRLQLEIYCKAVVSNHPSPGGWGRYEYSPMVSSACLYLHERGSQTRRYGNMWPTSAMGTLSQKVSSRHDNDDVTAIASW